MREYKKPVMQVEEFALNEAVANGAGCSHYDATSPSEISINCVIGGQSETVFNSCSTSATQYKLLEDYSGDTDYFVWFTKAGDGASSRPSDDATKFLAQLVYATGYVSSGQQVPSGWHYAQVDASGTDAFDTYTIS